MTESPETYQVAHKGGRSHLIDLTGMRFGWWLVLCKAERRGKAACAEWVCRCSCGTEKVFRSAILRKGRTLSCGCHLAGIDGAKIWKVVPRGTPIATRIKAKCITDSNGCWIWQGTKSGGYGQIAVNGKQLYVHRASYECFKAKIPDGLTLDHLCKNKRCCNPEHLEPVTMRVNVLRSENPCAVNAKKTTCPRGHEYDQDRSKVGGRQCRKCRQIRYRELKSSRA
jgi:hypothetical protein